MEDILDMDQVRKLVEIVDGHYDYKYLVVEMAKKNPLALLDIVGFGKAKPDYIVAKYFREFPECTKIEAIKFVRGEIMLGLKEAKDLVEEVADKVGFIFRQW